MTIEEIDIAQLFNVPCKVTVNGMECKDLYRISQLIRFYDSRLKQWKFSVMMQNIKWEHQSLTAGTHEIKVVEGWDLFISEKLKQIQDKEVYEKCKDKLMCRKETS